MKLDRLLQFNDGLVVGSADFLRSRLCIVSLYIVSGVLSVMLLISLATGFDHAALASSIILLSLLCILADYYRSRNLTRTGNAMVAVLYLALVPVMLFATSWHALLWGFLFPVLAIVARGGRVGLINTAVFYVIVFLAALSGIGEWNERGIIYYALISLTLTLIFYFFKHFHDQANETLIELLARERHEIENLQELSNTDPLTGLHNRRNLQKIFMDEANRARRHGYYLGFFIFDIDHFKRYNDQLGQKYGDKALQDIASVIKAGMRRSADFTFRLGGEEFGGLMVVEHKDDVMPQVERLMRNLEALEITYPYEGEDVVLTVSAGVLITDGTNIDNADDIQSAAESALYRAKMSGRNRAVLFGG
jgi:diguanylate cyclase (GGDEF)-like protein